MNNLTWKVITDEKCCQGNIRRIVSAEKFCAKIGEGLTFSIPTGAIAPGAKLKLFVGFEYTCPNELKVSLNGAACSDADFGMDAHAFWNDPTLKPYTIATYTVCAANAAADAQTVTVAGNPLGTVTYLELKIQTL